MSGKRYLQAACALVLCACTGKGNDAPATAPLSGATGGEFRAGEQPEGDESPDAGLREQEAPPRIEGPSPLRRDLIAEAGRAELDARGILVDLGSIDMHKYSRGGWLSGWGRNRLDGETTVARIEGRSAGLDVVTESPVLEIVFRAKGRGSLRVGVDKGQLRGAKLSQDYEVHRIALPKPLPPGRHHLQLTGRKASIDWIWLSESSGEDPPSPKRVSSEKSLRAEDERSYLYYLIANTGSQLKFSLEGTPAAEATIFAKVDGQPELTLWQGKVADAAKTLALPLPDTVIGKPMRLRFAASGGSLGWRELALEERGQAVSVGPAPKNVIVLLIDTQRADSFSVVNPEGGVGARAYEALGKTSTTFANAYNSENWTKPSIATIDTGLYPTTHLARWRKDKCSTDLVFLSEHLKKAGFATAALVSNNSAGPKFGFNQGWEDFEKTDNAKHAFGRALTWLDARDKKKPFFLYVQTIDPHVPFSVPKGSAETLYGGEYKGKLGPSFEQSEEDALNEGSLKLSADDARWLRALYDAEVLYHDEHLASFIKGLRERGILKDTAFVVLNDHGEEFGEQGRWGHGWTMGDALFRSPLLMHFPGYFPVTRVQEVVEHLDVAPTIVAALGLAPMKAAEGQSLLPLLHQEVAAGLRSALLFGRPKKRAIRVGAYKLVLEGKRKAELFDMAQDPLQATDVLATRPVALRLCELALGEAIANPRKSKRLQDRSELVKIRAQYIAE